jgi:hypothetical protein
MMTREEFMKIEKEWIDNKIPTMFYIGELQLYKNSLEARIIVLENEDPLGLNTSDKLRIQLEERLNCTIHSSQMDLVLEYIYDFLNHKEFEAPKTCEGCKHEHLNRYGDNHCQCESVCMRDFDDYCKTKEAK